MTNLIPRSFNLAAEAPVDFYNMLDDFFTGAPRVREPFKVDVQQNDAGYIVQADLPGAKKEEIDIEMNEEKLIISVKYAEQAQESEPNYIHRERRRVSMTRGAYLKDADADAITAKLEDGVLTVNVPKKVPVSNVHKIMLD